MNDLYYGTHSFTDATGASFSFDEEVVKNMVRRIYEKKIHPLTEIDEAVFNETWNLFNRAASEGFGVPESFDPDAEFFRQIRYNNAVFSAFRTHRLQNDIAARLLDEAGNLKSFARFAQDVAPITDHSTRQWLRTEYDTAVLRAQQAADWVGFEKVADILPNLRWMPTTSVTPDTVHKRYWEVKLTLPQTHPFWTKHRPGDRWNCKCSLEATDDPVKGAHVLKQAFQPRPDRGLDNNPGEDGKLFSDTHPYIANAHKGAEKAVEAFLATHAKRPEAMNFKPYKKHENGGEVLVHSGVNRKGSDYKQLITIANQFAKEGRVVKLTPAVHFKSEAYKEIYGSLIGSVYERKCPDLQIDGVFYEFENYIPPFKKRKISNMISHGMKQSSRIIINNTKGISDRYLKRLIYERINNSVPIEEIWLYEKGKVRMLFKKQ